MPPTSPQAATQPRWSKLRMRVASVLPPTVSTAAAHRAVISGVSSRTARPRCADHTNCPQLFEQALMLRLATDSNHRVTQFGENGNCHTPHSPCCASDDHLTAFGLDTAQLNGHHACRCSESCRAIDHRLFGREPVRQRHDPVGGHSHLSGVSTQAVCQGRNR